MWGGTLPAITFPTTMRCAVCLVSSMTHCTGHTITHATRMGQLLVSHRVVGLSAVASLPPGFYRSLISAAGTQQVSHNKDLYCCRFDMIGQSSLLGEAIVRHRCWRQSPLAVLGRHERSGDMRTTRGLSKGMVAVGFAVLLIASSARLGAQQSTDPAIRIGNNGLGGIVTGPNGPEAGVWVIAETTDLPTKFAKIVVTDDRGRYVIPDLPNANYRVWVRGYGLVDSPKVQTAPGQFLNLQAVVAPNAAAAAEYYPAIYWYAMLKIPAKSEFPGTGPDGNGMAANMKSQADWLANVKSLGCMSCHALGTIGTRTIPKELGEFKSSMEAWQRRIQSGQTMTQMNNVVGRLGPQRSLALWADWTDRIAAGELPFAKPERPQGIERNIVLTLWDWSRPTAYLHDLIGTDRRNPTLYPHGKFYGSPEESTDYVPILDPVTHTATEVQTSGPRPADTVLKERPDDALSVLGGGSHLGQPDQQSQPDDGRKGTGLVHRARAPTGQS